MKSSVLVDPGEGRKEMNEKRETANASKKNQSIEWESFLGALPRGKTTVELGSGRAIFRQGDPADSVFFLQKGKVKLVVTSNEGKEAIVAILSDGEFLGEGCLTHQRVRMATAVATADCTLFKVEKAAMTSVLHQRPEVSELFLTQLLSRNIRYEADLVDQLFNSSEKRLARTLLLLAHFGKDSRSESVSPRINQESLAQMVGTTRSRVSHFMNKFRKLGFIDYGDGADVGGVTVHSGLLTVVLHD